MHILIRGDNNAGAWLKPQEHFDAILTHKSTDHVPLLDEMHSFTLETILPKKQPWVQRDRGFGRFKFKILGNKEPLTLNSLKSMRRYFKNMTEVDISMIVAPMAALLSGATDASVPIRPLHASFTDFLTDHDRSGEYFVDVHSIHNDLAFASLGTMMRELHFNICDLPSSYLPNSEVSDLNDRIRKCIPAELHTLADSGRTTFERHHSTRPSQQTSKRFSITRYCYSGLKCLASSSS